MEYRIRKAVAGDRTAVIGVFNYFIAHSFAAYPEKEVEEDFFETMRTMARAGAFSVGETSEGTVVGFSLLKKFIDLDVFSRAAEATYFILPEHARKGLGTRMLGMLVKDAGESGADTLLAGVSSLNEPSLRFHQKHGFVECARFRRVGRKRGSDFDVLWMQKFL